MHSISVVIYIAYFSGNVFCVDSFCVFRFGFYYWVSMYRCCLWFVTFHSIKNCRHTLTTACIQTIPDPHHLTLKFRQTNNKHSSSITDYWHIQKHQVCTKSCGNFTCHGELQVAPHGEPSFLSRGSASIFPLGPLCAECYFQMTSAASLICQYTAL